MLLARIHGSLGFWDQARQHLEQASEAAPSWGEPLDLLAVVHEQLGNDEQARSFRERSEQHRLEGERLARQLSQEGPV